MPLWRKFLRAALTLYRPIIASYLVLHRRLIARQKEERHARWMKAAAIGLGLVVVLLFLSTAFADKLSFIRNKTVQTVVSVTGTSPAVDAYGHTNLLLLGAGDKDHDGIDLTDTVMLASIDATKTKSVALLSLPRDLYFLKTQNMGPGKINTLYRDYKITLVRAGKAKADASTEALREVGEEVGRQLGIDVYGVVKVDFTGFVEGIDALGGVDVDIPDVLVDTQYPGPNYTYETFSLAAGHQHLDGETALKFARSRHSTSDFDRSRRQQQIIHAIGQKVKQAGLLSKTQQILSLLSIVRDHMESTLNTSELIGVAGVLAAIDPANVVTQQLNDSNGLYGTTIRPGGLLYTPPRDQFDGAFVLLPVSIPEFPVTMKQIRGFVSLFFHSRSLHLSRPVINVLNAGAPPGSSRRLAQELTKYGLQVGMVDNAPEKREQSAILMTSALQTEGDFLAKTIGVPHAAKTASGAALTILLGKNYTFTSLQSFLQP